MAVNSDVCEAGAIGRMVQFGGLREFEKNIDLCWAAATRFAALLRDSLVELCDAASGFIPSCARRASNAARSSLGAREGV